MKYYISDLHFFHRNVNGMDHRGFETLEQMHSYMIEKWNSRVTDVDEVYLLGDFSFGNGVESWNVLSQLKGKIMLIEGNHDSRFLDDPQFIDRFASVAVYDEIRDDGRSVMLCHYPMPFYNKQYRRNKNGVSNAYMLYGHLHDTYDEYYICRMLNELSRLERTGVSGEKEKTPFQLINTFCVFSDYVPLTLSEWIEIDRKRRELINIREQDNGGPLSSEQWEQLASEIAEISRRGWDSL